MWRRSPDPVCVINDHWRGPSHSLGMTEFGTPPSHAPFRTRIWPDIAVCIRTLNKHNERGFHRLMESIGRGAQRFNPRGRGWGLCTEGAADASGPRGFAEPTQSNWRQKRVIQFVAMTSIAKEPGGIPKTVETEYVRERCLQIRPLLMSKNRQISHSRNCFCAHRIFVGCGVRPTEEATPPGSVEEFAPAFFPL